MVRADQMDGLTCLFCVPIVAVRAKFRPEIALLLFETDLKAPCSHLTAALTCLTAGSQ